jgi:acyl-CoA dehydrogenase
MEQHSMGDRWMKPPILEDLNVRTKSLGLWNLFLPKYYPEGAGLTNLEYACLGEIMERSMLIAPEACNCSAPDTGNMEVITKCGTPEHKSKWSVPLMKGEIRSILFMIEPAVANSDATNTYTSIVRDGDDYVINGRKWWSSCAMDKMCKVVILMGKTDTTAAIHKQQSMIIVPMDSPGVKIERALTVFGYDDAPHGHAEVYRVSYCICATSAHSVVS